MKPLRDLLMRDDLGYLKGVVLHCTDNAERLHSEQSIEMKCDWRVAIENTLESAHVDHVHADSLAKLGLVSLHMERLGRHSMQWFDITNDRARHGLEKIQPYFPHKTRTRYWHLFIYPNITLSSVGGFTYSLQHYFPTETGTVLLTRLYSSRVRAGSPDLGFFFDNAAKFNRQVFEEDAELCRKIHLRCCGQQMRTALKRLEWFAQARNAGKPVFFTTPNGADDGYFYQRFMQNDKATTAKTPDD